MQTRWQYGVMLSLSFVVSACSRGDALGASGDLGGAATLLPMETSDSSGGQSTTGAGDTTANADTSVWPSTAAGGDSTTWDDAGEDAGEGVGDTGSGAGCSVGAKDCPCGAGGACDAGLACSAQDTCVVPVACESDKHEPNNIESAAPSMGTLEDEGGATRTVAGRIGINFGQSPDWFHYHGIDVQGAAHQPRATISANGGLQLCVFVECDEGTTELKTCHNGSAFKSPAGRLGCCTNGTNVAVDYNCGGTFIENASIYTLIHKPTADCVEYTMTATF